MCVLTTILLVAIAAPLSRPLLRPLLLSPALARLSAHAIVTNIDKKFKILQDCITI